MFNGLNKPSMCLKDVVEKIKNNNKSDLNNSALMHLLNKKTFNELLNYEQKYLKEQDHYNLIKPISRIDNLTINDSINLYSNRFKKVREEFLSSYYLIDCPICGREEFKTNIDHVLPKSKYVQYSITPINLVPMCSDCNKEKGDDSKVSFHPYFEDYSNLNGLKFNIKFGTKLEIELLYSKSSKNNLKKYMMAYGMDSKIKRESKKELLKINNYLKINNSYVHFDDLEKCINQLKIYSYVHNVKWKLIFFDYLLDNIEELCDYLNNN